MPEFKLLNNIIDHMESSGSSYKLVMLAIDKELVDDINKTNGTSYSLSEIEKAADKCLAYEWLLPRAHSSNKYGCLGISPKGVGAARSRRKAEQLKASRSWLKKSSDAIEEHKGLLIFIGSVLALATFILKIIGDK